MANRGKKRSGATPRAEHRMAAQLDRIAAFNLFEETILPQLQRMVLENWAPDRIRKAFAPLMQGMMIQKGLQGNFRAIKDTLDRYEGLAVQRVEQRTVYAQMSKQELAALALQKLRDAKIIDVEGQVIKELPALKKEPDDKA